MRTVPFGPTGGHVPNVVAGMMRIKDSSDEDIQAVHHRA